MKNNQTIFKNLKNKKGEAYIDTAFKILIAIVVGALLFSTIYTLFDTTILTKLTSQIDTLFSTGTSLVGSNSVLGNSYGFENVVNTSVPFVA